MSRLRADAYQRPPSFTVTLLCVTMASSQPSKLADIVNILLKQNKRSFFAKRS